MQKLIMTLYLYRYILLFEKNISLYNYQGKLVASPKWPNMKLNGISQPTPYTISVSNDTIAVRDASDEKCISES